MLCLAWLLHLPAVRCIAHLLLCACALSAHPPLISRLRKVWQKRKCTISNGYLTISHSMVGTTSSTLLCCCLPLQGPQSLPLPGTPVASWGSSELSCLLLALLGCPGVGGFLLRLKSLQPKRALDKHRRSLHACVRGGA